MKTTKPTVMNSLDNLSPGAKATLGHLQEIMAVFSSPAFAETIANVASKKPEAAPATFARMPKTPIKFTAKVVVDYRLIPYENIYDFGAEIDRLRDLVFQKANSLAEQFEVSIEDGYFGGWRFNLEVIFEADELAEIAEAVAAFEDWVAGTTELKLGVERI